MRMLILAGIVAVSAGGAFAAEPVTVPVTIKDHRFEPAEIKVPAGQQIIVEVTNADPTPEEFESHELKVEKIIPGNSKAVVRINPLDAGKYPFVGEYNEDTAKGVLIVE